MTDYTERVNALREHADLIETSIELYGPSATRLLVYDLRNAAAAIEALQAEQKKTVTQIFGEEQMAWEVRCKDLMKQISELQAEVKQATKRNAELHAELEKWVSAAEKAGEPKRGELMAWRTE